MGTGGILIHLKDHVGLFQAGQIDSTANRQSLILLVLFYDAFRVSCRHAGGILRGTGRSCLLNSVLLGLRFGILGLGSCFSLVFTFCCTLAHL